jgi:fucose permease
VSGAGLGVLVTALGVPMVGHLALVAVLVLAVLRATRDFFPVEPEEAHAGSAASAWREPRTLAIGLMALAFALTEGAANDWLALALIDGYDAPRWVGVLGFAGFVVAMTAGRLLGTVVLDRYGRVPVLRATAVLALAGLLLLVLGPHPVLVGLGVVAWGLGASLGFPVGMSAGADDPARAAARVSVVSTLGYAAFLAGPPVLGFLGDRVGTLESLLVVAVLLVPTLLLVSVAREPATDR